MPQSPDRSDRVLRASSFVVLGLFLLGFGALMLIATRDELLEWGYKMPNWLVVLLLIAGGVAALVRAASEMHKR